MKRLFPVILLTVALTGMVFGHEEFRLEKKEKISQEIAFDSDSGPKELKVDNVFGRISVKGTSAKSVKLTAAKWLRADTQRDLEKAQREISLKINREGGRIEISVDGPFRRRNGSISWSEDDYRVGYDFELEVPVDCDLNLRTVTDGDIEVENVRGELTLRNVNGKIEFRNAVGPITCKTVNGKIEGVFNRRPDSDCVFATVNGGIRIAFPKDLRADFSLKTMHGDIYTDFPVKYLPSSASGKRHSGEKFIYSFNKSQKIRIGEDGPLIKMETLNGDLLIADKDK